MMLTKLGYGCRCRWGTTDLPFFCDTGVVVVNPFALGDSFNESIIRYIHNRSDLLLDL
ncbi:MAG: hypothetical protein ACLR52_00150 [Veillonella atypica]